MESEYSPLSVYQKTINNWWIITLLFLFGGIVGMIFHSFRPPIYETKAVFTIHIDFTQTDMLSEFEQDYALNTAKHFLHSSSVIERVQAELARNNIPLDAAVFGKNVFVERKQPIIEIIVRNHDPHTAASVANIWAEQAFIELKEAFSHALQAESIRLNLAALESCGLDQGSEASAGICDYHTFEEIKGELEAATNKLQEEVLLSRGIFPALVFDLLHSAPVPETPSAFGRNFLILGGALVGFFSGALISSIRSKGK
jgi:hypothetical protein